MGCREKGALLNTKLSSDELVDFSVKLTEYEKKMKNKYSKISEYSVFLLYL